MSDREIALLQKALRCPNSSDAWVEFLHAYSPILYQTAHACTSNEDAAAGCYLHICESLARNGYQRLLKFKPGGSASFTTWLRVVARNLCFDWHRSQAGRPRPFKSFQHLSPLELEVYHCRFIGGASPEETLQHVQPLFPSVSLSELSDIEERLQSSLTSRQRWILAGRQPEFRTSVAVADKEGVSGVEEVADASPNQEEQVANQERQAQLRKNLASLPAQERLLVQLRFEQELSLDEIARLCGLQDAQRVHRTLAAVLKKLRAAMR